MPPSRSAIRHWCARLAMPILVTPLACSSHESPVAASKKEPAVWSGVENPALFRRHQTTTLLPSGKLLVLGGEVGDVVHDSAELYDPTSGEFAPLVAHMTTARTRHSATLLADGSVLVVGGWDGAVTLASAELYLPATQNFVSVGALGEARAEHTATLLADGGVAVIGGKHDSGLPTSIERFDPTSGTFSAVPGVSAARFGHTATRLPNSKVYLAGGIIANDQGVGDAVFDPAAGSVTPVALSTGHRYGHTTTLLPDGRLFLAGGVDPVSGWGDVSKLIDPSNGNVLMTAPQLSVTRHTATLLRDGNVLLTGGVATGGIDSSATSFSDLAQLFDPVQNQLISLEAMEEHRADHTATLLPTGSVVLAGGSPGAEQFIPDQGVFTDHGGLADCVDDGQGGMVCSIVAFAPSASTTLLDGDVLLLVDERAFVVDHETTNASSVANLAAPRGTPVLSLLSDGRVLITGGNDPTVAQTSELFDPSTQTVSPGPALTSSRSGHTASWLPSGDVWLVGGRDSSGALATTERFDLATGSFVAGPSLPAPRSDHSAVPLATGELLIAGGAGSGTALVFEPASGTFSDPIPMAAARVRPQLTLLESGRVLVTGGASFGLYTELFDPQSRRFLPGPPLDTLRRGHRTTLLMDGRVLITGGEVDDHGVLGQALLFEPASDGNGGELVPAGSDRPRAFHTTALLPSGEVLSGMGRDCRLCPAMGNQGLSTWSPGPAAAATPTLSSVPSSVTPGEVVTISGTGFAPPSSSDGTTNQSSSAYPVALWRSLTAGGLVSGTLGDVTDTSAQWTVPATALYGPGQLAVAVNGVVSAAVPVSITPAPVAVPCGNSGQCQSGFCVDGVCCDRACDGFCEACTAALKGNGSDGTCGPVAAAFSTSDECEFAPGAACQSDGDCTTGHCVDQVCCDSACTGQCEACNVEGSFGTCVPVLGVPRGTRPACSTGDAGKPCSARLCDGTTRNSCAGWVGGTVECRAASCSDGVAVFAASCDGAGSCPTAQQQVCEPYVCDGTACGAPPCQSDAECSAKFRCAVAAGASFGDCVPRSELECDGDHTVTAPDGTPEDCSPFRCDVAGCKASCSATADCVSGAVCDTDTGRCRLLESDGSTPQDEGCGCSVPGQRGPRSTAWLGLVAALFVWTRRRRAGSRSRTATAKPPHA